jgi:hypothetical protein
MDSMPLPVCRFAWANRCRRLREVPAYSYDEVAKQKCFGLRVHARIAWPGVVCDLDLLPANVHDTVAAEAMLTALALYSANRLAFRHLDSLNLLMCKIRTPG